MLRSTGARVEVQNYIDNTGVQVADVWRASTIWNIAPPMTCAP
jgi:arginyl-tRNA synthetase